MNENVFEANSKLWDMKTDVHITSDFYSVESFKKGQSSLTKVELDLLGEVKGKSILHLQCHFGMDTLSLAREGALCVGVDLSPKAIETAKNLNSELGTSAAFICSNILDLPKILDQKFDIVFTSFGVVTWLPDLLPWGGLISSFLKPTGKFVIVEFHPVLWMLDDSFQKLHYSYFNEGAIIEEVKGTYADREADICGRSYTWNHSLSEVISSLQKSGLLINSFEEYPYLYHNCFPNLTTDLGEGRYCLKDLENKVPLTFSLTASPS